MLTLYMQQVLGYSPMKTAWRISQWLERDPLVGGGGAAREPHRREASARHGMVALTSGLVYFTQVSVHGTYLGDLLPGFLLVGVGLASPSCRSRSQRSPVSGPPRLGLRPACSTRRSRSAVRSASRCSRRSQRRGPRMHSRTNRAAVGARAWVHRRLRRRRRHRGGRIVAALTLIRRDELEQAPEQLEPVLDLAA